MTHKKIIGLNVDLDKKEALELWCQTIESEIMPMGNNILLKTVGKLSGILGTDASRKFTSVSKSPYVSQATRFTLVGKGSDCPEEYPEVGTELGIFVEDTSFFDGKVVAEKKSDDTLVKYIVVHCLTPSVAFRKLEG